MIETPGTVSRNRCACVLLAILRSMVTIVVLIAIFLCFDACSIAGINIFKEIQLPEHIYKRPPTDLHRDTAIGVFRFLSPEYAPGSGYTAAAMLYKELLERDFGNVVAEFDVHDIRLDNIMEIAEKKDYGLITIGKVGYYFFGGKLRESRVDEEIRVIDVLTGEIVWCAETIEIGRPVYAADYIFFSTAGKEAPSPEVLMHKNARKFCNMLLTGSKNQESLSREMRLVNDGYNYLVDKKYEKAKILFEESLKINPDNAYAMFNLGLVHEKQGNKEDAIIMYLNIIALNSEVTGRESKAPIKVEQSLVDLAWERLRKSLKMKTASGVE